MKIQWEILPAADTNANAGFGRRKGGAQWRLSHGFLYFVLLVLIVRLRDYFFLLTYFEF